MTSRDVEAALAHIDRVLMLNPNFTAAWAHSGILRTHLGDSETAIQHIQRAMRLSPRHPLMFLMHTSLALAHFLAVRHDLAWPLAERACREQPHYVPAIRSAAACNAAAGRRGEAKKRVDLMLRLDPSLRISRFENRTSLSTLRPDVLAKRVDALRKAGLPE